MQNREPRFASAHYLFVRIYLLVVVKTIRSEYNLHRRYAGGMYGRANAQDTDYAKENRDALKSQAQHLLGSGGLTNPGSFAAATAGYAAGAVRQFFTIKCVC